MGPALSRSDSIEASFGTYSLVWLDATVNSSKENVDYQERLRAFINQLYPFDNENECLKHIQSLSPSDRVVFICSGRLGQNFVPKIHNSRQIHSIYVFCKNREANEKWSQPFAKASCCVD